MKLAYILKTYPRLSQTFVVNEIVAHERAGLDLQIFALRRPKAEDVLADVGRVQAPVRYLTPADADAPAPIEQALERLVPLLRHQGITHLHAHFANSAAELARQAAARTGLPWSLTAHARDIFHASVDRDALARRLHEADAVITVSDFNRAHLLREFGRGCSHWPDSTVLDEERLVRLYNGLDTSRLAPDDRVPREPFILGVGRLVPKKGFSALIAACAHLQAGLSRPWRCVIAGSGPQRAELEALAASLGVAERIDFLGAVSPAQVVDLMRRAAVFAAPCVVDEDGDRDGMPTVLLEAMALGCPVVASAVTGIPELVVDQRTGRLLPALPTAALAAPLALALADVLNRPAHAAALALAARAHVAADFDITRNSARQRDVFALAAERHQASPPRRFAPGRSSTQPARTLPAPTAPSLAGNLDGGAGMASAVPTTPAASSWPRTIQGAMAAALARL